MKSTTVTSPIFFLLILLTLSACNRGPKTPKIDKPGPVEKIDLPKLTEIIRANSKPFALVNVYATWCKPCKIELPELIEMQTDPGREVELILITIDNQKVIDDELAGFLQEFGIGFKTFYISEGTEAFFRSLYPDWDGTIPLNLLYNQAGEQVEAMGLTDRTEIEMLANMHKKK